MRILIMGLPGSGKTTQSKLLSEAMGFCFVKTGDILRDLAKKDDDLGKLLREALEAGTLADNETVSRIVKERVSQIDCQNGFVMDGYPRSLGQLQYFDPEFDKVFFLNITREESKKRLLARGRSDDSPDLVDKKIEVQEIELTPVLDYFEKNSHLIDIDGSQSIDAIHEQIKSYLA